MKFPFFSPASGRASADQGIRPGYTPLDIFSPEEEVRETGEPLEDLPCLDEERSSAGSVAAPSEPTVAEAQRATAADLHTASGAGRPTQPRALPQTPVDPEPQRRSGAQASRSVPQAAAGAATRPSGADHGKTFSPEGSIGAILVSSRRISADDAHRVVATQLESSEPFGVAAVRLGVATPSDIEFALSQQFSMPRLEHGDAAIDPEVVAAFHPDSELVERLRNLRGQIAIRALDAKPAQRSITITSVERGVGRSYVAANLATVFAQLGARTLLIDGDLVHARQHKLFKISNRVGLSSILAGRANLSAVCPIAGLPGFAILPAGPMPPNPHDLIARPTLGLFLRRCEQDFDVIIIDTPAWTEGSSARMICAASRAAVMLLHTGRTAAVEASAVGQEIAKSGARVLGAVFNRP